jgi:hypothetical protein
VEIAYFAVPWAVRIYQSVDVKEVNNYHHIGWDNRRSCCNWMGYFLATIICPGMFPLAFTILWKEQSAAAATIVPLLGLVGFLTSSSSSSSNYWNDDQIS